MQLHFFIIYDSIKNSVFTSQVVHPLLAELEKNPTLQAHIISFERKPYPVVCSPHPRLTIHIMHKIPFIGSASLWYAARQLRPLLTHHASYTMTARGPLAGAIARNAQTPGCTHLTIQARGLLAEEYRYVHAQNNNSWFMRMLHRLRAAHYESLEANIFGPGSTKDRATIQVVSPALKEYLVAKFNAESTHITIADHDAPAPISIEDRMRWRSARRAELAIPVDARVYCYSGSAKSWQCPQKVISYFKDRRAVDPNAILLILTTDTSPFKALLHQNAISADAYRMICAKPDDVCEYLSACDVGLLFREPHPLNWVSRPTKALEYQAAGLVIEHNNTVAMLTK